MAQQRVGGSSDPSELEVGGKSSVEGFWASLGDFPRILYWGIHASCLLALWVGVSTGDFLLFLGTFLVRVFAITGFYHRYFSHKTYQTSRPMQFLMALLGVSATQKGPLWWAGNHRIHHKYADVPGKDVHSPGDGLYHAHQGWIFDGRRDATPVDRIRDFAAYPELIWLNRWHIVGPLLLAGLCYAVGGWSGVLWGFSISTVALWHATYSINSLAHVWGSRRYATRDTSRNNLFLALLTLGEGWHNNHHHYCASTRQGFFWWEIDITYYLLRGMAALGLIWNLREPPEHILRPSRPDSLRRAA